MLRAKAAVRIAIETPKTKGRQIEIGVDRPPGLVKTSTVMAFSPFDIRSAFNKLIIIRGTIVSIRVRVADRDFSSRRTPLTDLDATGQTYNNNYKLIKL